MTAAEQRTIARLRARGYAVVVLPPDPWVSAAELEAVATEAAARHLDDAAPTLVVDETRNNP